MSIYTSASNVSLDSIPLQVNPGGLVISGIAIIDENQEWLARERIAALRDEADELGFDMINIYGARIHVTFSNTGHAVTMNNDIAAGLMYRKILRKTIAISGSVMSIADFSSLYTTYDLAQQYWAKREILKAQISDNDVSYTQVSALIAALAELETERETVHEKQLVSPFITGPVLFDQGSSLSFNSYVDGVISDYSMTLISDTLITYDLNEEEV